MEEEETEPLVKIPKKVEKSSTKWTDDFAGELHRGVRHKFRKRRVFSPTPNHIWAADLCDLKKFSRANKGFKYLLMVIDVFSKYAYVKAMKNKTAGECTRCFREIFTESKESPRYCWVDKGTEFWNRTLKDLFKEHGVTLYSTESELKSCIVERFIRTYKTNMFRYFTANRTREYLSKLDELTERYNTRKHRSIQCTPEEAKLKQNFQFVFDHLYPKEKRDRYQPYHVGDEVRIARKKSTFEKGYEPNFTEQVYEVSGILPTNPITYSLKNLNGAAIKGSFYRQNLVRTKQRIYFIEKVVKRRVKKGVKQMLVRWSDYGPEFDSWIQDRDVVDTSKKPEEPLSQLNVDDERISEDEEE